MARCRNIKPGFFENEDLGALNPLARILFAGLWTIADREGRLEDRPERIKKQILPYDRCKVDNLLDALQAAGFILRYQVDSHRCIWILNFRKHQHPHLKEPPSTLPAPDGHHASHDSHSSSLGLSRTSRADYLITESRILTPLNELPDSSMQINGAQQASWDLFIADWPNKVNVEQARLLWFELLNGTEQVEELANLILAGKERYRVSAQWARGYVEAPDNWLRKKKWLDNPQPASQSSASVWDEVERQAPDAC